jgi:hypothetical protein
MGDEADAFCKHERQGLWVPAFAQECPGKKFASRYKCLQ